MQVYNHKPLKKATGHISSKLLAKRAAPWQKSELPERIGVSGCQHQYRNADCQQAAKYLSRKRLACIEVGHSKQVRCNVCSVLLVKTLEVGACIGVTSSLLSRIFQGAAWARWWAILMIGLETRGSKISQKPPSARSYTPNISPKKSAYIHVYTVTLHLKVEYILYTVLRQYQVAFYYKL